MPLLRLVHSGETSGGSVEGAIAGFEQYLNRAGCSPTTIAAYLSDCRSIGLLDAPLGHDDHVRLAEQVAGGNSAVRTRMRRLSSCARFYDYLVHRSAPEVLSGGGVNPYRTVRRPRLGVVLPRFVPTPEQSRAVIAALASKGGAMVMYAAAVAVMAGAGLRVDEVCSLRLCDVDMDNAVIHVVDGKGRKSRDVPASEAVLDAIRAYLDQGGPSQHPLTPDGLLFPRSPRSIQRVVKAMSAQMGSLDKAHPHAFRHGFATAVYGATTDLRLVADLLGHSSISTTMIYTHVADQRRASSVAAAL